MMTYLDSHAGSITAIATIVLIFLTAIYVLLTYKISSATGIAASASQQAAAAAERANAQTLDLARTETVHRMIDRFLAMIETIEFRHGAEHQKGAQALKALWIVGKNSPLWKRVEAGDSDGALAAVHEFFGAHLSFRAGKAFGDFETLAYYYLFLLDCASSKGGTEADELVAYILEFHPREMAFLSFMICAVRQESKTAKAIIRHRVLDRAITLKAMLPFHRTIVEKFSAS